MSPRGILKSAEQPRPEKQRPSAITDNFVRCVSSNKTESVASNSTIKTPSEDVTVLDLSNITSISDNVKIKQPITYSRVNKLYRVNSLHSERGPQNSEPERSLVNQISHNLKIIQNEENRKSREVSRVPLKLRRENSDSELYAQVRRRKKESHVSSPDKEAESRVHQSDDVNKIADIKKLQVRPANYEEFIAELKQVQKGLSSDINDQSLNTVSVVDGPNSVEVSNNHENLSVLAGNVADRISKVKKVTFEQNPLKKGWASLKEELQYQVNMKKGKKRSEESTKYSQEVSEITEIGELPLKKLSITKSPDLVKMNDVSRLPPSNIVGSLIQQYTKNCLLSGTNASNNNITKSSSRLASKNCKPLDEEKKSNFRVPKVIPREPLNLLEENCSDKISDCLTSRKDPPKSGFRSSKDIFFGARSAGDGGDCDKPVRKQNDAKNEALSKSSEVKAEFSNIITGTEFSNVSSPILQKYLRCNVTSSEDSLNDSSDNNFHHNDKSYQTIASRNDEDTSNKKNYNQSIINYLRNNQNERRDHNQIERDNCFRNTSRPQASNTNSFSSDDDDCGRYAKVLPKKKTNNPRSKAPRRRRSVSSLRSARDCSSASSEEDVQHTQHKMGSSIRSLEDLSRFRNLEDVTLRNNQLLHLPTAVFTLVRLKRLNLDNNLITELPANLCRLASLEQLSVSNNRLISLANVSCLPALQLLRATRNCVAHLPTLSTLPALRYMDVAHNSLPSGCLIEGRPEGSTWRTTAGVKPKLAPLHLHLNSNLLHGPCGSNMQHVTSLCLGSNQLSTLDVCSLTSLRELRCSYNVLTTLSVHGALLTKLEAHHNELTVVETKYPPRQLVSCTLSSNCLAELPSWLELCGDLTNLDVSRNQLANIPQWMPMRNIVTLSLHHNKLTQLLCPDPLIPDGSETSVKNKSSDLGDLLEYSSVFKFNDDIPPPTPPRMPTVLSPRGTKFQFSLQDNVSASISTSLKSQLQHKRPAPLPPSSEDDHPPPLPPPPQFLTRSNPPLIHNKENITGLSAIPPPLPPLPPHLRQSSSRALPTLSHGHPIKTLNARGSELSDEDDHYEECGRGNGDENEYHLEVLLLHHNRLKVISLELLQRLPRLRILNVSNNQLTSLPSNKASRLSQEIHHEDSICPTDSDQSSSSIFRGPMEQTTQIIINLEEFYGGCNSLCDLSPLQHCRQLRVLHVPYNELTILKDSLLERLPHLQELVIAGNHLQHLPRAVTRLKWLRLLRLNCNPVTQLPTLGDLPSIKIIDASHCTLGQLQLKTIVTSTLVILDVSENPSLSVPPLQVDLCRTNRAVSVIDATKDKLVRGPSCSTPSTVDENDPSTSNRGCSSPSQEKNWTVGFAECIGRMNRQSCTQLRAVDFDGNGHSALFGLAEVPTIKIRNRNSCSHSVKANCIQAFKNTRTNDDSHILSPMSEETKKSTVSDFTATEAIMTQFPKLFREDLITEEEHALKYSMLSSLRKILLQGNELPVGFCVAHLEKVKLSTVSVTGSSKGPSQPSGLRLRVGSCGSVVAMLVSRSLRPLLLTPPAIATCSQVCLHETVCCESSPVSNGEMPTLPDPTVTSTLLSKDHQALVIASQGLWDVMDIQEVNQICVRTADPSLAARRLLTLAQSYGASCTSSILVIDVNTNMSSQTVDRRNTNTRLLKDIKQNSPQNVSNIKKGSSHSTFKNEIVEQKRSMVPRSKSSYKINSNEIEESKETDKIIPKFKKVNAGRESISNLKPISTALHNNHYPSSSRSLKKCSPVIEKTRRSQMKSVELELNRKNLKHLNKLSNSSIEPLQRCLTLENGSKIFTTPPNPVLPSTNDRSSPSGQSFSDRSVTLGEDGNAEKVLKIPMWPGQMGPVAPSGPFALDLNRTDDEIIDYSLTESVHPFNTLHTRGPNNGMGFKRDRMSIRSTADSFISNSTRTTKTGIDSIRSSRKSSEKAESSSVPVFRPFYHFPSPNSLVLLNKSNAVGMNTDFLSSSSGAELLERSSFESRSNPLQNILSSTPSVSKSLTALSEYGAPSEGDMSDFSWISKGHGNFPGSEQEQVSEEQLRSFEYVLAKNAKMLYMKDLENASELHRLQHQTKTKKDLETREQLLRHTSVPDLVAATWYQEQMENQLLNLHGRGEGNDRINDYEQERKNIRLLSNEVEHNSHCSDDGNSVPNPGHHFQRGIVRKSRFGGGTVRILQNRQGNGLNRTNASQRNKSIGNKNNFSMSSFKRFGSLQNLKNYQSRRIDNSDCGFKPRYLSGSVNKANSIGSLRSADSLASLRPTSFSSVQLTEMQEKRSLDSVELDSRMNQYWQNNTTCF